MILSAAACGGGGDGTTTPAPPPPPPTPVASVAITPDSAAVLEGQSATFTATARDGSGNALSGRAIAWTVSDATIASVAGSGASAQVTGLKPGLVTVTATSEGRAATARYLVRPVPVSTVALSSTSVQVIAGRAEQLSATTRDSTGKALPGRAVSWSSDATAVATVSATGVVTGVAPGTARITAASEGKTAGATVVVTPAAPSGTWGMPTTAIGSYWLMPDPQFTYIPFAEQGDFNNDGLTDFVITSWTLPNNSALWHTTTLNPAAPVKIYLQLANGTFEDATVRLVGSEVTAYAQLPLIADVNRDGIDDIILPGFTDLPPIAAPGLALVSSGNGFVRRSLPKMWAHGAAIADANLDGCLDLVTPDLDAGFVQGDCTGTFTARPWAPDGAGWPTGMHACVADFNADGRMDVLMPDAFTSRPRPLDDNVIFEMDWTQARPKATAVRRLPMPVWDRGNTNLDAMKSHDQRCLVGDLNSDGRPDVLVSATLWATDGVDWKEASQVQVYLNRGNWTFEDLSDQAFPGRTPGTQSSFSLFLRDVNGDGHLDMMYPAESYLGLQANQLWLGNGNGTFRAAGNANFAAMLEAAKGAVRARRGGSVAASTNRQVIPLRRRDGRYDFVVPVSWNDAQGRAGLDLEFSPVGWVF